MLPFVTKYDTTTTPPDHDTMDYVSPLKEMYAELGAMMEKAERRPGWIEIKPETSKLMNKIYDLQNEKLRRNEPLYTIEPGYLENCGEFIIAEKQ